MARCNIKASRNCSSQLHVLPLFRILYVVCFVWNSPVIRCFCIQSKRYLSSMYTKRVTGEGTDVYVLLAGVNLVFGSHRSLNTDYNRVVDTSAVNLP